MTSEQVRFLILHARTSDAPIKWRWMLGGGMLRAYTERGHTATISNAGRNALIAAGLMREGRGCADMVITEAGRKACASVDA